MSHQFVHIHASGRFDATPAEARAAWDDFRSTRGVKLITATEYGSGKFDGALKADGWDYFRGSGECVVAWATDTFEPAWRGAGYATRIGTRFFRGGNHDARTPLTSMPLRHIVTGRIAMVRVPHTPAHIQAGDGFRKTTTRVLEQGRAWVTSLAGMGRRSRRFRADHKNAAEIICGDFNVDVHRAHWRGVVSAALGLHCATPIPDGGDLGKRLVSWFFYRGLGVATTGVMRPVKGFDHKPVLIRWSITASRP
ncbi:hypothetical protein [Nocardioides sp. URHA0032]|uniref:hypothetical protein n=1 Tax=Nocardioides sp. URHA0032 TaxID=1380388 RepID=UPI000AA1DA04|nr:hypothetical protein [Nocardioides sp. URHA0032]